MIKTYTDLTVAEYVSLEEIQSDPALQIEAKQADVIMVGEYLETGIYHAKSMLWQGKLAEHQTPEQFIRSKRERKSLAETREYFLAAGYQLKTQAMDLDLYQEFSRIYQEKIVAKDRPLDIDLETIVKGKILAQTKVYLIGLYNSSNQLESGLVFSLTKEGELVVAVGAKKRFNEVRGGIGGLLELELLRFCKENNINRISHGKGFNPAGLVTKAGLFEFKARYGFSAFPNKYWVTTFIPRPEKLLSDLIFVTAINDKPGYIVVSNADEKDVIGKYRTSDVRQIRVITFAEVAQQYAVFKKEFLETAPTNIAI